MNHLEAFRGIHTFIFDVDGVFTNSNVLILENGKLLRQMNVRDGYAVKKAIEEGYTIAIVTGGKSTGVTERLKNLGIENIYSGVSDKLSVYEEFLSEYELNKEDEEGILYMGDDIPDYDVMCRVGLPACPKDAAPEIIRISRYISSKDGGAGCVRDVIEKVLKLHGKWKEEIKPNFGNIN